MSIPGCLSCDTVSGQFQSPGGIIYENTCWIVALQAKPLRSPCNPFIILKRHCEQVHELTAAEAATLGPTMKLTAQVLMEVVSPVKVHFGLYAESVKHIHLHVFPRMSSMPQGNIPSLWINQGLRILSRVGLKQPYSDEEVTAVAAQLREAFGAKSA